MQAHFCYTGTNRLPASALSILGNLKLKTKIIEQREGQGTVSGLRLLYLPCRLHNRRIQAVE